LQGRFVDNPKGVLIEADQLVRELMQRRGYQHRAAHFPAGRAALPA